MTLSLGTILLHDISAAVESSSFFTAWHAGGSREQLGQFEGYSGHAEKHSGLSTGREDEIDTKVHEGKSVKSRKGTEYFRKARNKKEKKVKLENTKDEDISSVVFDGVSENNVHGQVCAENEANCRLMHIRIRRSNNKTGVVFGIERF